jgi:micrococcal nuclease
MRRRKNKVLILIIICFVFFILADRLYLLVVAKNPARNFIATSSVENNKTHPVTEEAPLLPGRGNISSSSVENLDSALSPAITTPQPLLKKEGVAPQDVYYPVLKVVDGDTIDIGVNGKTERLRLIGINTPEIVDPRKPVECFGREASDNAKKLLDGAEVKIAADPTQDDKDIYGRLLRYVWRADGLFYNLEAVKDGFAYEYTYRLPYIYQKDFKAAQKYAQDNQLGLWADGACNKKNIIPALKNNSTAVSSSTNKNCIIKGNISSGGVKIYHLPGCSYYKQTIINESQGEKWFCTEAEALAAGWRKAGNCP